jgi:ribonuclease HI
VLKLRLRVYSDGASRGNPGISAIAFMILTEDGRLLKRYSKYFGIRTNNQAEYEALILRVLCRQNLLIRAFAPVDRSIQ